MKAYQSITFKVEKDLKKPVNYLPTNGVKEILGSLFETRDAIKDQLTGRLTFLNKNKPLEIFHYSLDTNETQFFSSKKKSLIQGLIEAYKNHYGIVVSPDWFWLLIMQGYSRFMEKYFESVRERIINFSGKKELNVLRINVSPKNCPKDVWDGIIQEFINNIETHVGKDFIKNLEGDFSTTTPVTKITSQVTIMSAMKEYFTYKVTMIGCGISSITLEGSVEDWTKIKSKLEFLASKGLKWWTTFLIPIVNNIIATKIYLSSHKKPSKEIKEFWKGMIRLKGTGDMYDPHMINGWIIQLIPNLKNNQPTLYNELSETDVPDQILSCPMELTWIPNPCFPDKKIIYNCSFASGFYGMVQDKNNFNVRPVIGYAIVAEEEKK